MNPIPQCEQLAKVAALIPAWQSGSSTIAQRNVGPFPFEQMEMHWRAPIQLVSFSAEAAQMDTYQNCIKNSNN
ncbi:MULTISPECIES: hypothetical protein [unclassified Pseudomonas]|uniref:hypothetical protein n=1 Tax=unclassified Pseudomonas TaxID=196821 RepID=UPI0011135C85|nr:MULTISPECIES: hypothetical protein [unclassified Pseudomonas]